MTNKMVLGLMVALLVIGLSFLMGYKYYSKTHPITVQTDTLYVYDTITHIINNDNYIYKIDTIKVPEINWDTIVIEKVVQDYYNIYSYNRSWSDSTISVNFTDFVSENKIKSSTLLAYKLLQPQTTVINSTEINQYHTYLNISLNSDIQFQYPEIRASVIMKDFSFGAGYLPKQEALTLNLGYNILKLK